MQHSPDRGRADLRQAIRCASQGTLQRVQCSGCRPVPVAIWRPTEFVQDPFALGWTVHHRWCTTIMPGFGRQPDLGETCHPMRDRIAHRPPDESRCLRVRAVGAQNVAVRSMMCRASWPERRSLCYTPLQQVMCGSGRRPRTPPLARRASRPRPARLPSCSPRTAYRCRSRMPRPRAWSPGATPRDPLIIGAREGPRVLGRRRRPPLGRFHASQGGRGRRAGGRAGTADRDQ